MGVGVRVVVGAWPTVTARWRLVVAPSRRAAGVLLTRTSLLCVLCTEP